MLAALLDDEAAPYPHGSGKQPAKEILNSRMASITRRQAVWVNALISRRVKIECLNRNNRYFSYE